MVIIKNIFFKWVFGDLVDVYIVEKGEWIVINIVK